MLLVSHKVIFIENETVVLRVTMREHVRAFPAANLVYNFLI